MRRIDYQKKNLKNPFFRHRPRNFSSSVPNFLIASRLIPILIIFISLILFWIIFFSSAFKITHIQIKGLSRIPSADVEHLTSEVINSRKLFFKQSNLIFLNKDNLEQKLNERFSFAEVDIDKDFPKSITISVQEKLYSYVWCEAEKYYYSDNDGYISDEVTPLEIKGKNLPIIQNNGDQKVSGKNINFDSEYLKFISELFSAFPSGRLRIDIDRFIIDNEVNMVKVKILSGPDLYFNIKEGIGKQLEKLTAIKNDKLKDDFINKAYIDLRFGDRVYYR